MQSNRLLMKQEKKTDDLISSWHTTSSWPLVTVLNIHTVLHMSVLIRT